MEAKHKNVLIGGLLAIVFVMAVGYAAFSTQLNIGASASTGGTSGNQKWEVKITNIEATANTGTGSDVAYDATTAPNGTRVVGDLTANFQADLQSPGDSVTYTVTVTNSGTLTAKLVGIDFTSGNTTSGTGANAIDVIQNTHTAAYNTTIAAGATYTFTITTTYNTNVTSQPDQAATASSSSLILTYVQA